MLAVARFCKLLQSLVTTGLPTLSQIWQPLASSGKKSPIFRHSSNDILITLPPIKWATWDSGKGASSIWLGVLQGISFSWAFLVMSLILLCLGQFFFNCMFYQFTCSAYSCSSTQSWGSVLPSIVETRDQNSRGCPLLFSNRNLGFFCA